MGVDRTAVVAVVGVVHVLALLVAVVVVRIAVVPAVLFRREGAAVVVVAAAVVAVVGPLRVVEVPATGLRVRAELEPRRLLAAFFALENCSPGLRRVALDRVLACVVRTGRVDGVEVG